VWAVIGGRRVAQGPKPAGAGSHDRVRASGVAQAYVVTLSLDQIKRPRDRLNDASAETRGRDARRPRVGHACANAKSRELERSFSQSDSEDRGLCPVLHVLPSD
jgi:hypothetical protein